MVMFPTHQVTFRQKRTDDHISAWVSIRPLDPVALGLGGEALKWTHEVTWDDTWRFANGAPVSQDDSLDFVLYQGGPPRSLTLLQPRRSPTPTPIAMAYASLSQ